jgi:hypothetical protein
VVDDLTAAVRELEAAGIELLGGEVDERGGGGATFARRTATSTS